MTDQKTFTDERRYEIVQRVREKRRVQVADLAETYAVSAETIRKDLTTLQEAGFIRRTHGGAVPVERSATELGVRKRTMFTAEKHVIAARALAHVPTSGSIFIESGSTSLLLAELLPDDAELTVFTNSLPTAISLAERPKTNITVVTLGGRVRPLTLGEVDNFALRSLREIHVDVAFLGTNGVSALHGLTVPDNAEAEVKRAALGISHRTVLLTDRSKIGTVSLWRYGSVEDIDIIITSEVADAAEIEAIRAAGVSVELTENSPSNSDRT
ncbi:DeoR/GlpR family DNA-binding transcription regulator [Leucobacter alluvii]|uniref:Lactose phosphotransferase system repressor n=1 Tax=Leucobacter alluvii TaxID=340321 RepID=A0ABN3B592_9MICO